MAARNDKKKNRLTRGQLFKLWTHIGVDGWLNELNEHQAANRFTTIAPNVLKGLCVHADHQDTAPSAFLYVARGYYKCHGGSCEYYESNAVRFMAAIHRCSFAEALRHIIDRYKPSFIHRQTQETLDAEHKNQRVKHEIFGASHDIMCAALGDPTSAVAKSVQKGLDWLIQDRKIPKGILQSLPVGLMPELSHLALQLTRRHNKHLNAWKGQFKKGKKLTTAPPVSIAEDAVQYLISAVNDPDFVHGGIVFPLHVSPTEIGRIKLRVPQADKKFVIADDDFEDLLGLYGLGWGMNKDFLGSDTAGNLAYLVEGEMDALSMFAHYAVKGHLTFPVFSVGGKGGAKYIEPILSSVGVTDAYLVGDAPQKQGDDIAQMWLSHIHKMPTKVFVGWKALGNSGDVDEALHDHGITKVLDVLWEKREDHFIPPWNWAYDRAMTSLDMVAENDIRALMEGAAMHGRYLHHRLDREHFIDAVASQLNLNPHILKREINSQDHTELGFISACADTLRDLFAVIGTQKTPRGRGLLLYNRGDGSFQTVQLGSATEATGLLAPFCGTLINFVQEYVGAPGFLTFPDPGEPEKRVVPALVKELNNFIPLALAEMTQGAVDLEQSVRKSQGYHCLNVDGVKEEFIVCGKKIFRMDRTSGIPEYTQLDSPIYKKVLFDTGMNDPEKGIEWYPAGLTTDLLHKAQKEADLQTLYDDLVKLYSEAFRFKHHEVTAQLMAALIMSFPAMSALSHPVMVFITGDQSSGKTSLMSTLSNLGPPGMRLLYSSSGHFKYSAPSVGRTADAISTCLCLDEFENSQDGTGDAIRTILEMLRGQITGESDRMVASGSSGIRRESYRLPVVFAAIQGADRPQDLSRLLQIETQKIEFRISPAQVMKQLFTKERVQKMTQDLNLGMFSSALDLAKMEGAFLDELPSIQKELKVQLEWRLASNLAAPIAIMRLLGRDWKGFLKSYVEKNEHEIVRLGSISETEQALTNILYAPIESTEPREPNTFIAQLLVNPEQRPLINAANKGIFFDDETNRLLIQVDLGVFMIPQHLRRNMTGQHLKNLLGRHPAALDSRQILSSGIIKKAVPFLGAGVRLQDVVVVDITRWMDSPTPTAVAPPTPTANGKEKQPQHGTPVSNSTGGGDSEPPDNSEETETVSEEEKDDGGASKYGW